ncbi:NAD(P)/FAD-dependent oxidoreductase [Streptomyces sp. DSM 40750]|uniref:NAD(P)/FAD-dependent oxidoreductase n=1 Tax=Streptomyces sp. DSM 40750 TaxID=2801030 RepID=UPI00214A8EFE|nr:NAD(P)/FAD-dependent oxidoreductase [Streptomyces sp. DSM 40750]UUU25881.1 NAD(P)/FAD-dependent oxidoreductase [Streptomyces sp. DSM 40750]
MLPAVELADGTWLPADAVVVATGVRLRRLPGGDGLSGVHVLRTLDDALALRTALIGGPRLVVVGADLLGTEAAVAARGLGADVTLVGPDAVPLLGLLGPQAAGLVAAVHRGLGLHVWRGGSPGSRARVAPLPARAPASRWVVIGGHRASQAQVTAAIRSTVGDSQP